MNRIRIRIRGRKKEKGKRKKEKGKKQGFMVNRTGFVRCQDAKLAL
jgi:hypothetical protein